MRLLVVFEAGLHCKEWVLSWEPSFSFCIGQKKTLNLLECFIVYFNLLTERFERVALFNTSLCSLGSRYWAHSMWLRVHCLEIIGEQMQLEYVQSRYAD